jgi:hypothetical protein
MRKKCFLMLLILCFLLSACGERSSTVPEDGAAAPAAEASPSQTGAEQPVPPAPSEAPQAAADPAEAVPAGEAEEQAIHGVWTLCEEGERFILLVITRDPDSGAPKYYLRCRLPVEEGTSFTYRVTLNDSIVLEDSFYCLDTSLAFHPYTVLELPLGNLYALGALRPDEELRFRLELCHEEWFTEVEEDQLVWKQDWVPDTSGEATVPAGFEPDYVFLPCMGALVQEQLLLDGDLRVTLLGMGIPPESDDNDLACLLRVENRAEKSLPFSINGLTVNNACYDRLAFRNDTYRLPPGAVCYPYACLSFDRLEEMGIDAIREVNIRMMTKAEEDHGALYAPGGTWHPVRLITRGEGEYEPEIERVLYEDELVRIALAETDVWSGFGEAYYSWRLAIWNLSGQDVLLTPRCGSENEYDFNTYGLSVNIRAGSWAYTSVHTSVPEGTARSAVSFTFDVHSYDESSVLAIGRGPVLLD